MAERPNRRLFQPQRGPQSTTLNWNNGPIREFCRYAEAFHNAAKVLVNSLDLDLNPNSDWNACPVVFLYRHSAELYLKGIVLGDGANFLQAKPDPALVLRTHSLKRLFPFLQDIFNAVSWEGEFDGEGISDMSDLEALIRELDDIDSGSYTFRYPVNTHGDASVKDHFNFSVREFANRMDAVLEFLDTADFGLAAMWDQRAEAIAAEVERRV